MLDDRANALKIELAIERFTGLGRIENHGRGGEAVENAEHQRAANAGALDRGINNHHAESGNILLVGPPHRCADKPVVGIGDEPFADGEHELPVFQPMGPIDLAGKAMRGSKICRRHLQHVKSGRRLGCTHRLFPLIEVS